MASSSGGFHHFIFSCLQTVLRLIQSSSLSAACSRLLLQITSSLLLGENISLPKALIQETVQKVSVLFMCRMSVFICKEKKGLCIYMCLSDSVIFTRCLAAQWDKI